MSRVLASNEVGSSYSLLPHYLQRCICHVLECSKVGFSFSFFFKPPSAVEGYFEPRPAPPKSRLLAGADGTDTRVAGTCGAWLGVQLLGRLRKCGAEGR